MLEIVTGDRQCGKTSYMVNKFLNSIRTESSHFKTLFFITDNPFFQEDGVKKLLPYDISFRKIDVKERVVVVSSLEDL
jgi:predicted AAA+ superfamily ATPase